MITITMPMWFEVDEGDYLKRDKVIDTISDVLTGLGCDDDDIYDVVRVFEDMPGESDLRT